jgi:hypothetical protein
MNLPIIIVDDFYKEPDKIREYALQQTFYKSTKEGTYPGIRTNELWKCDKELDTLISSKIFSILFDFEHASVEWNVSTHFQYIEPYNSDKNSFYNKGWVHKDHHAKFACMVYLTPNADLGSGTSFYKQIKEDNKFQQERLDFYVDSNTKNYISSIEEHLSCYDETIRVNNIYNRMVMFDSNYFHAANNLHSGVEPRLTQISFITDVKTKNETPIQRMSKFEI